MGGRGSFASYSHRLWILRRNFIHFKHHPQALIASRGQLNAPLPSLKPSEESKQKPGHQPVKPTWGLKMSNTAKQILPSCIDLHMQIHMIVYSARAVDIVSVCVLM